MVKKSMFMLSENEIIEFLERNKDYKILLNYCEDNNTIDCIFAFDFNIKNLIKSKTNYSDYYFIELNGEYLVFYEPVNKIYFENNEYNKYKDLLENFEIITCESRIPEAKRIFELIKNETAIS